MSSDSVLYEYTLDGRILTIDLTEEMFLDYTDLQIPDFVLKNYPTGLSIQNVNGISPTQVNIQLAFDGADIDMDFNFAVGIHHSVLKNTDTLALYPNSLNISVYIEQPVATITADSLLNEGRLDSRILNIKLIEEKFINYTSLLISNFVLVNAPAGLTIESVEGISPTQAKINLSFDGTDFDIDITDFRIKISSSILLQTVTGYLSTNNLIIFSTNENLPLSMSAIVEDISCYGNCDGSITPIISGGTPPYRIILNDLKEVYDLDSSITNLKVGISNNFLQQSKDSDLISNELIIYCDGGLPSCTLTSDSVLTESNLGRRYLELNLLNENFVDYQTIIPANFQLVNYPAGLTIESVLGISPTRARIYLDFDGTDFDVVYANFYVRISKDILVQSKVSDLSSSSLMIVGVYIEQPVAILTPDSILIEGRLNARVLAIELIEEKFRNYANLHISDFTLVNAPTGLIIQSVTGISPVRVNISLQFDGTDFDEDIFKFRVDIKSLVLVQTVYGILSSSQLTILADVENSLKGFSSNMEQLVATITADTILSERCLNYSSLTVDLSYEEFINYLTLLISDFTLINAPPGLSVEAVTGISETKAILDLQFDGTDFDVAIINFHIRISKDVLVQSTVSDLESNSLIIYGSPEVPIAIMMDDSGLYEFNLDRCFLVINLVDEKFLNYSTLSITDFTLNNEPIGLVIQSVTGISPVHVLIALQFDGTDFDTSINNFSVTIDKSKLLQSTTNLTTNTSLIHATVEFPVLLATPDSILHELTLDRRSLTLKLTDEKFLDYTSLDISSFYLLNAPNGLQIESVSGINSRTAVLNLAYAGTDLDNLCAGITKLTVTDANGCSKSETFTISEPDSLYLTKTVNNVTCNDGSDGSITIDVHGGILPYNYLWSTGEITEDIVNIPSGKYWISVSDANGWSITDTTIVHEPLPIQVLFNGLYGSCEGEIIIDSLTVSGGTPPHYIKIDDNLFLNEIHQDGASHAFGIFGYPLSGWHTIVIKDANECESEEFSVLVPYQIKIEFEVRPLTCFNGSDANINSIISGGTNPYEYIWNTGETSDYLTDIDSGTYILKITDFKGCIGIDSVKINNPAPVLTGDIIGNTMVQQSSIESYSVSETSGSNYNWVIKSGDIVTGQGSNSIQVQWASPSTGKVSVIKTDENLCQGDTISINVEISTGYFSPSIEQIRIFPNPFNNKTLIQFPNSNNETYKFILTDISGKRLRELDNITSDELILERGEIPAGLYLIELGGPKIYRGKIIIE